MIISDATDDSLCVFVILFRRLAVVRNGSEKRGGHQVTINEILIKKDIFKNILFFTSLDFVTGFFVNPGYFANVTGYFANGMYKYWIMNTNMSRFLIENITPVERSSIAVP